uniref:Cytochrome P450 n=1 Tax=Chenopodium quinoa TaxID=63459 RepID=A0A803MJ23_CHEQI
ASGSDRVFDLQDVLERFAFDNICKLAFDFDPGCLAGDGSGESEFMRAFDDANTLSAGRFLCALPFNIGSEKRLRESIKTVHNFAEKIIRMRLEEVSRGNISNVNSQDLLSRFISANETSRQQDGTLPEFLVNRHRFLDWSFEILSPIPTHTSIFFRPGKVHGVITAYPPNVEHFLKTRFDNYPKGARFNSLLYDFLGTGIFNSDDHLWRHQRKTASFEFNKRSLKNFVLESVRFEIKTRLIPIFKEASGSDRVLDLQDILERFAFDNVCKLAFDFDPGCLAGDGSGESEFMRAFEDAASLSAERFMCALPLIWKVKKFLNIGSEKRLRESIKTVHGFADKIIQTSTYGMGRMESIWGMDCLMFRPERWIDENGCYKSENSFKYPVFHAGPRICLGKEMAYLQMKSIVACVVEQFDVEMLEKEKCPQYLMSLTLRVKDGLPVKVKARQT